MCIGSEIYFLLLYFWHLTASKTLQVKDPEQYEFRPKELLRDLCAIFALFATSEDFQEACARNGCKPADLRNAVSKCHKYNLLTGESMIAFDSLPDDFACPDCSVRFKEDFVTV